MPEEMRRNLLDESAFRAVVARAALYPSVHNTQPARWRRDGPNELIIRAEPSAQLRVGDPTGDDMGLSLGAAVRATELALSERGIGCTVEERWDASRSVRLTLSGKTPTSRLDTRLAAQLERRFTWRDTFEVTPEPVGERLDALAAGRDSLFLTRDADMIRELAETADALTLSVMRERAYREELVDYLRLTRRHPRWHLDGLNAQAMRLSRPEAAGARVVLGTPLFGVLARLGLGRAIVGEGATTRSAAAIAVHAAPRDASPVMAGRAFLEDWLLLVEAGVQTWSLAVLSDDPAANADLARKLGIPDTRRIVHVWRAGTCPTPTAPGHARLSLDTLLE